MKLERALELARSCGMSTYREAYSNVNYHAMNIFAYDKINDELRELAEELKPYMDKLDEKFK